MKILIILTSHDQLGDTGKKTGFWLEEFAAPYYALLDAGAEITLASPAGGQPPLDPKSDAPDAQTKATERFKKDVAAQSALANTTKLAEIDADGFDALFFPGGHGPLWDLVENENCQRMIEAFMAADRPLAAVCHAPAVFKSTKRAFAKSVVSGRRVTGFSNTEEASAGLTEVVPFLVEDMLKTNGGLYEKGPDWESYVVVDGKLITGQNPASSEAAAKELLKLLLQEPSQDAVSGPDISNARSSTYPKTFSHVGISVSNLEAAVAFYEEVMGWYTIMKPTVVKEESDTAIGKMCIDVFGTGWGSFKIAHLSTGDRIGVEMFEFKNNVTPSEFEYWKTGTFHFCVQDPNIEALVEKIVARGGKQRMPIREYYPGEKPFKMVYVEDPFGLVFEIYTHSYELTYSNGAY